MLVDDLLHLARVDVVAAADDQLLLTVDDEEATVLVDPADVARVEPPVRVDRRLRRVRTVPVALHDVVPADRDLTHLVARHVTPLVVDELHLDTLDGRPYRPGLPRPIRMIEAGDRRGL